MRTTIGPEHPGPKTRLKANVAPAAPAELSVSAKASADRLSIASTAWAFSPHQVPGFYDAGHDQSAAYNLAAIQRDVPAMWKKYGPLFKKVGVAVGADPYAMAAYCVFESYNSRMRTFNPRMIDIGAGMVGAGLAATQAQDWKGRQIPGTKLRFPKSTLGTAAMLRKNPEYGLRCLASEMRDARTATGGDLARVFPAVAYPAWGSPRTVRGNYGTQAQYVSRAYVLYQAFQAADRGTTGRA